MSKFPVSKCYVNPVTAFVSPIDGVLKLVQSANNQGKRIF